MYAHNQLSALDAAREMCDLLRPHCDRIEIAGSVRRGKVDPKDIEIVAVGDSRLLKRTDELLHTGVITQARYGDARAKDGQVGTVRWGEKYRGFMFAGWRVELFTATEQNFGAIYWLRTGPGDANTWLMKFLNWVNAPFRLKEGYWTALGGTRLNTPDERNTFELLNIPYLDPANRSEAAYQALLKKGHVFGDLTPFMPSVTQIDTAPDELPDRELFPLSNLDDWRVLHRYYTHQGLQRQRAELQAELAALEPQQAQAQRTVAEDKRQLARISQIADDGERVRASHRWKECYGDAIALLANLRTLRSQIAHLDRMLGR